MIDAELEVHAAALYTALVRAGQLERARAFQRWWVSAENVDENGRRRSPLSLVRRDSALYDADELGLDPEHDDEY